MLMSWLFWGVVVLAGIALLARVPGFDIAFKPIGILLQDLVKWIGATFGGYLVFLVKTFFGAHLTLLNHLIHKEEHFNVELKVKKEADN